MQIKDKRISEQERGINLNLDDSGKALSAGDVTYALSCVAKDGNLGKVTNEKGNTLIAVPLAAGVNRTVLTAQDFENNAIIYGVFNSNNNHALYRYNIRTNTVEKIVDNSPILGFRNNGRDGLINHPKVVNGLLIWVDGGEPRKVNIQRSIDGGYVVFDAEATNLIKTPPVFPPTAKYITNYDIASNYVRPGQWKFAYRYIHKDFEKTVFSPVSKVPYTRDDYHFHAAYNLHLPDQTFPSSPDNLTTNLKLPLDMTGGSNYGFIYNGIEITLKVGHEEVDKIELIAFDSTGLVWFIAEEFDNKELLDSGLNPGDDYSAFIFYNDKKGLTISDSEVNRTMDLMPREPKAMEFIHSNELVFGNFKDGFNLPEPDLEALVISTIWNWTQVKYNGNGTDARNIDYKSSFNVQVNNGQASIADFNIPAYTSVVDGDVIYFYSEVSTSDVVPLATHFVNDADVLSQANFDKGVLKTLSKAGLQTGISIQPGFDHSVSAENGRSINFIDVYVSNPRHKRTYKTGSYHKWGIVYYGDGGRHSSVVTDDAWKVYIPHDTEIGQNNTKYHRVRLKINHTPPDWATHYQIVYAGNLTMTDAISFINPIDYLVNSDDDYLNNVMTYRGHLVGLLAFPNFIRPYVPETGDKLRLVGGIVSNFLDDFLLDVTKFDEDTQIISTEIRPKIFDGEEGMLSEVYKPITSNREEIFNEIGHVYPIIDAKLSTRRHGGETDQVIGVSPAEILMDDGDAWKRFKWTVVKIGLVSNVERILIDMATVEDFWFSDYWKSSHLVGRPYGVDADFKETLEINLIRYTGKYFEGTKVNELNTVRAGSEVSLNIKFGEITTLIEVGYVLKCLQFRNNTSLHIGRQVPVNPDGTEDQLLSDRILGTIIPSSDDFGTEFPESVVKHDRHLYFYDHNYGAYIRDSANGMIPISQYKMASHFKALGDAIKTADRNEVLCMSSWDEEIRCVVFTAQTPITPPVGLPPPPAFSPHTLTFDEGGNRWKSFHPWLPEQMEYLGKTFVTFSNGELWIMSTNNIRGSFYGIKFAQKLRIVSNIHPDKIKVFHSIATQTNRPWSVPSITIPGDSETGDKLSQIEETDFEYREGVWYAALKKDSLSPEFDGSEPLSFRLINGEEMRGNVCYFELENSHDEEVVISRAIIISTPSELSE